MPEGICRFWIGKITWLPLNWKLWFGDWHTDGWLEALFLAVVFVSGKSESNTFGKSSEGCWAGRQQTAWIYVVSDYEAVMESQLET